MLDFLATLVFSSTDPLSPLLCFIRLKSKIKNFLYRLKGDSLYHRLVFRGGDGQSSSALYKNVAASGEAAHAKDLQRKIQAEKC